MKRRLFILSLLAGTLAVSACAKGNYVAPDLKGPAIQILNNETIVDLKQQMGTKVSMSLASAKAGRTVQAFKEDVEKYCCDLYRGETKLLSFEVRATGGQSTINLLNLIINEGYSLKIWAIDRAGQIVNDEGETPKEVPIYLTKDCQVKPLSTLIELKKDVVMKREGRTNDQNIVTESEELEDRDDQGNPEDDETHLDMASYLEGTLNPNHKYIAFNEVKGACEPEYLGFVTFSEAEDGLNVTIAGKTFQFEYAPHTKQIRAICYENTKDYLDLEDAGPETYYSTLYPEGIPAYRYHYADQYGCLNDLYFTDEGLVGIILTSPVGVPGVIDIQRLH